MGDKKDKKKKEGQKFEIDVPGEITVDAQPDVVEETVVIPDVYVEVETPAVDMPEIEIPTVGFEFEIDADHKPDDSSSSSSSSDSDDDAVLPTDDRDKKKVKKVKVKKEKKPKEKKEKKPKEKKEKKPRDKKDKKKKEGQTFEIDVPGEITVDAQPDVVEETVVIP